jgi:hypothetical protein
MKRSQSTILPVLALSLACTPIWSLAQQPATAQRNDARQAGQCHGSGAQDAFAGERELSIPNFDADSPACVVKIADGTPACTADGCTIPMPNRPASASIQLRFSCLPKSAPTGFDNPAPEVKVSSIRARNSQGHLSLMDDLQSPPAERMRELNFCLYGKHGKHNNFCGYAKVWRSRPGLKTDANAAIQKFIQELELN